MTQPYRKQDRGASLALISMLFADADACHAVVKTADSDLARRNYIRASFAAIEGMVWSLRQDVLLSPRRRQRLTQPALSILRERVPDVKSNGDVAERAVYLPFKQNIRFTFRAFYLAHGEDDHLAVDEEGWSALLDSVEIRDRLTHPKDANALVVSDDELLRVREASRWVTQELRRAYVSSRNATDKEIAEIDRLIEKARTKAQTAEDGTAK
jgi:hypothetical protein